MSNHFSAFGISTNNNNNNQESNYNQNHENMNPFAQQNNNSNNNSNSNNTNQHDLNPFHNAATHLPIYLSLNNNSNNNGALNNPNSGQPIFANQRTQSNLESMDQGHGNSGTNNSNQANNAILKNLRHYVYGAENRPSTHDNDHNLVIDLPDNINLPAPLSREDLNKRKNKYGLFSIRLTPYIDTSAAANTNPQQQQNNNGLFFEPIIRTAGPGSQLVIGRYTERVREAISKLPEQYHPVVFKSKVISRAHGCFKVDSMGNWYIKDVKSSSGTFLNHQRLSPASTLSKDYLLHDGDILQLGMDFRGGIEEIYKCVKMKVELNRSWKRKANTFNKEALKRIKNLQKMLNDGIEEEDCSICLSRIKPCQAIFISPCSHSWHFHCIRRLIMMSYPQFVCPNCRSTCDLEANLSESEDDMDDYVEEAQPQPAQAQVEGNSNDLPGTHAPPLLSSTQRDNKNSNGRPNNNNNDDISSVDDINMA